MLAAGEAGQKVPFVNRDLPDALPAYRHFLDGNGAERTFSYERYVRHHRSGEVTLRTMIREGRHAAYDLWIARRNRAQGTFQFTGTDINAGIEGSISMPYPSTENWQKAIGGHDIWLSGTVSVGIPEIVTQTECREGPPRFEMELTLHVEDMYNFNPGQADLATGIPDADNGRLATSGLGHQYLHKSTLVRTVAWQGQPSAAPTVTAEPPSWRSGRRHRKPGDNRRLRNRI